MDVTKKINPIKEVLVKKKRTYKWLAEQLRKGLAAMPKWCSNTLLPGIGCFASDSQYAESRGKEVTELHFGRWSANGKSCKEQKYGLIYE